MVERVCGQGLDMSETIEWYYTLNGTRIGPIDAHTMRSQRAAGAITDDTFCWRQGFGADWRPYRNTELFAAPESQPASIPLQGARLNDLYAWLFVISPVAFYLLSLAVGGATSGNSGINTGLSIGVYAGLRAADKAEILKSGRTPAQVPGFGWVLLSPGYLWRRATLLGESRNKFWIMIAVFIATVAVAVGTNGDFLDALHGGNGQLSCRAGQADALRIFNTIDAVKKAGIEGASIADVTETTSTPEKRSCHAVITAKDAKQYPVDFQITKSGSDTMIAIQAKL